MIELTRSNDSSSEWRVKVLGIGGAGTHAVDRLSRDGLAGVEIVAANTDARALSGAATVDRMVLGHGLTRGLGAGGDPELGRAAAQETAVNLADKLAGASLVVLLAGLGGGTGSGATPLIAQIARAQGAHVAAFVTLPFTFEGRRRREQAMEALDALRAEADLVVCFENDRMPSVADPSSGIEDAFESVDSLLAQAVRAILSMTRRRNVMHSGLDEIAATVAEARSTAVFGYGVADGEERARAAVARAFGNPLLDAGGALSSASRLWVYVCGGPDMRWHEVQVLMSEVAERMPAEVRLFFGAAVDAQMSGAISVTLLAGIPGAPVGENFVQQRRELSPAGSNVPGGSMGQILPPVEASTSAFQPVANVDDPAPVGTSGGGAQSVGYPQTAEDEADARGSGLGDAAADESNGAWRDAPPAFQSSAEPVRSETTLWQREVRDDSISRQAPELENATRELPTPPFELSRERRQEVASRETRADFYGERTEQLVSREEQVSFLEDAAGSAPHPVQQTEAVETVPSAASVRSDEIRLELGEHDPTDHDQGAHHPEVRIGMDVTAVAPTKENGKRSKDGFQEQMRFDAPNRGGRFEKTDPTIVDGEDLDVPTFMRRKVSLE